MSNIRTRIALFFNIKTSAALDQVEDPREVRVSDSSSRRAEHHRRMPESDGRGNRRAQ
jgi:hypothetical protein